MIVPAKTKIERLVSKDTSRPVLASLYLRIEGEGDDRRGYLEGTDSYKLGRIPVEIEPDDTEGFVPVEAIVAARKNGVQRIVCNGSAKVMLGLEDGISFPRLDGGQFPNTHALMDLVPARCDGAVFEIGLSPRLLLDLAESWGATGVAIRFTAANPDGDPHRGPQTDAPSALRPMHVRPLEGSSQKCAAPGATGLLMPVKIG